MTAPKHLWSGDWEEESSAHAEDLATRRPNPRPEPEPEPRPEPAIRPQREPRPPKERRSLRERLAAVLRPPLRVALLVGFLILVIAGGAYAVISDSNSTNKPQPIAANNGTEPWLGVDLASAPIRGALVASVVPGSPAARAGIRPGDVITQLDTQPIEASATLVAALSGMQPGDTVDIQLQRGASQYTVHAQLAGRSASTP